LPRSLHKVIQSQAAAWQVAMCQKLMCNNWHFAKQRLWARGCSDAMQKSRSRPLSTVKRIKGSSDPRKGSVGWLFCEPSPLAARPEADPLVEGSNDLHEWPLPARCLLTQPTHNVLTRTARLTTSCLAWHTGSIRLPTSQGLTVTALRP
jgi:hypothetical protein